MTNPTYCPREKEISYAGSLDAELAAHIAACPVCRDVWLVARGMEQLPSATADPRLLPDPSVIWRRAELRRIALLRRKALAPVILCRRLAWLAAGLAAALLTIFHGSALQGVFLDVAQRGYSTLADASGVSEWKLVLDVSLAAAGGMVVLALSTWLVCLVRDRLQDHRPGMQIG
ncbi:MAG: hypothetical protein JXQ27_04460 [Acidobacteria bacterium]|nr:hypothetical protein [Acidobacteriota bacterium]